ncbi:MAG TPA: hypothetical protein VFI97_03565 [Arthrobacter sp.]|nr:hypothetical protein [Arthrobacter sp.]
MTEPGLDAVPELSEPEDGRSLFERAAAEAEAAGFGIPATVPDDAEQPSTERPRRGRPRRERTTATPKPPREKPDKPPLVPYREGMFVEVLESWYTWLGMGLMLADPVCAQSVIASAHDCAVAIDKMSKQNHALRRWLVKLTQTSDLTAVIVAHLPILAAVAFHHVPSLRNLLSSLGLTPAGFMQTVNNEWHRNTADTNAA